MIFVLTFQQFKSRYATSTVWVKTTMDSWEFYAQDGIVMAKAVVDRSDMTSEDQIIFQTQNMGNQWHVLLDVIDVEQDVNVIVPKTEPVQDSNYDDYQDDFDEPQVED